MVGFPAIMHVNHSDGATYSGTTPANADGWAALSDPQPRERVRYNATSAHIIIDIGTAPDSNCGALISCNGVTNARLRCNTADSWAGAVTYDSGSQSGFDLSDEPSRNVIWASATTYNVRYWRWDLAGTNPMSVGLTPIGDMQLLERSYAYGSSFGYIDTSIRDINPDTGIAFGVRLAVRRQRILQLPYLTDIEQSFYLDLDRNYGAGKDTLYIDDTDISTLAGAAYGWWGTYRRIGGDDQTVRRTHNQFSRTLHIVERI